MRDEQGVGVPPSRRRLVGLLLVAACVAIFVATRGEDAGESDLAMPVARSPGVASGAAAKRSAMSPAGAGTDRRAQAVKSLAQALAADVPTAAWPPVSEQARRSWEGPDEAISQARTPPAAASMPPESLPPVPFEWIGLWNPSSEQDGEPAGPRAIIADTHTTRIAKAGDLLDDDWRIDDISKERIRLTYLPSRAVQTLLMNKK